MHLIDGDVGDMGSHLFKLHRGSASELTKSPGLKSVLSSSSMLHLEPIKRAQWLSLGQTSRLGFLLLPRLS